MDNTPAAAQPTEAIPQTLDTKPMADTTNGSTPETTNGLSSEQVANFFGTNAETLERFQKFVEANGKFDKAFEKMRSDISNPQQNQQNQPEQQPQQVQETNQPQQSQVAQPNQPPTGYASLQELSVERYFKDLASDPKYANISEQISSGEVLKEMARMGIAPIDENYNINVDQLSQFLALKSASVPAKPTSVEPTNIPTVEYTTVEGNSITSAQQAMQVLQESMAAERSGLAPHPAAQAAREYIRKNGL